MLDIKFLRENPEVVKQNIRNKFQDRKLPLVDQVIQLDQENRDIKKEVEALRAQRNKLSKQIGALMGQGKREEAEEVKAQVAANAGRVDELTQRERQVEEEIRRIMMTSCHASEGKSFITMNMMRTFARLGKRVVLVDADLRRSMILPQ